MNCQSSCKSALNFLQYFSTLEAPMGRYTEWWLFTLKIVNQFFMAANRFSITCLQQPVSI